MKSHATKRKSSQTKIASTPSSARSTRRRLPATPRAAAARASSTAFDLPRARVRGPSVAEAADRPCGHAVARTTPGRGCMHGRRKTADSHVPVRDPPRRARSRRGRCRRNCRRSRRIARAIARRCGRPAAAADRAATGSRRRHARRVPQGDLSAGRCPRAARRSSTSAPLCTRCSPRPTRGERCRPRASPTLAPRLPDPCHGRVYGDLVREVFVRCWARMPSPTTRRISRSVGAPSARRWNVSSTGCSAICAAAGCVRWARSRDRVGARRRDPQRFRSGAARRIPRRRGAGIQGAAGRWRAPAAARRRAVRCCSGCRQRPGRSACCCCRRSTAPTTTRLWCEWIAAVMGTLRSVDGWRLRAAVLGARGATFLARRRCTGGDVFRLRHRVCTPAICASVPRVRRGDAVSGRSACCAGAGACATPGWSAMPPTAVTTMSVSNAGLASAARTRRWPVSCAMPGAARSCGA